MARPSTRLLCAVAALAASASLAPAAGAAQPEPLTLIGTSPTSDPAQPAQSTTPLIMGRADDGGITTVTRASLGFPVAAVVDPGDEVEIYASADCSGAPVATGSLDELEGSGIEVEVAPESATTFTAILIDDEDPGSPSGCSNFITYWHSATPATPPEDETPSGGTNAPGTAGAPSAPRLRTVPGGRANDNAPLVAGSAPGAATVKVFSTPGCGGPVAAKGSAEELGAGLAVRVADNSVTTFSAVSVASGGESACSAPVTYVEDSAAPRTRITMGPGVKTRRRKAVFRFTDTSGDPPGTTFLCKVDRRKWGQCHSPFKLKRLGFRRHVLRVRAIDVAGNAEAKGAKRSFKVLRSP